MPKTISQLSAAASLAGDALFEIERVSGAGAPASEKATLDQVIPASAFTSGRLTLEASNPISSADQIGVSTLRFTPFNGNLHSVFSGTRWERYSFNELTATLSGLTAGKNYDVILAVNSGALYLDLMPAWTTDTARSSGVSWLQGRLVNSSSFTTVLTGRNVASNEASVVGTIRATGTTTTEDSAAKRFVANLHNRVLRVARRQDAASHSYLTGAWRNWNNVQTYAEIVQTLAGSVAVHIQAKVTGSSSLVGWAQDAATPGLVSDAFGGDGTGGVGQAVPHITAGYHFFALLEFGTTLTGAFEAGSISVSFLG